VTVFYIDDITTYRSHIVLLLNKLIKKKIQKEEYKRRKEEKEGESGGWKLTKIDF
jgi:hypothetical protein